MEKIRHRGPVGKVLEVSQELRQLWPARALQVALEQILLLDIEYREKRGPILPCLLAHLERESFGEVPVAHQQHASKADVVVGRMNQLYICNQIGDRCARENRKSPDRERDVPAANLLAHRIAMNVGPIEDSHLAVGHLPRGEPFYFCGDPGGFAAIVPRLDQKYLPSPVPFRLQ